MSDVEISRIDDCVQQVLQTGAIEKCQDQEGQFISTVFTVPKSSGGYRFVINLKQLNQFIAAPHFKMEDIRSALSIIRQNDFLAVLDQKDAYHKIAICYRSRKYLRFRWKSKLYQFTCLPFGLNVAPWLFTKIMKPVLAKLRSDGLLSVSYLDDCLLIGRNLEECENNIQVTINTFKSLGLELNYKKSQIIPAQKARYLGFILDSSTMNISIPNERKEKVLGICHRFMLLSNPFIHDLAILIGNLVACIPALQYSKIYLKQLEYEKVKALNVNKNNYKSSLCVSNEAKQDIEWWIKNIPHASRNFKVQNYNLVIFTDASLDGYGGKSNNNQTVSGVWSSYQKTLHINVLELLAVHYSLLSFNCPGSQSILLRVDNTTVIAYLNNQGGVHNVQCHCVAKAIWQFCEQKSIVLRATYIASRYNVEADKLSRLNSQDQSDFSLGQTYFNSICQEFFIPVIDLFASHLTTKCEKYVSWQRDPGSVEIDAFTISWPNQFYAFPPFNLVSKVLAKVERESVYGILVVPNWPAQSWFPGFMSMVVGKAKKLKRSSKLLFCPFLGRSHSLSTKVEFLAAVVRGSL